MNLYELQERANILVEKVNSYEASIPDEQGDETTLISQHKFADIFCLRAVMQYILGNGEERKSNTTLNNSLPTLHTLYRNFSNTSAQSTLPNNSICELNFTGSKAFQPQVINYVSNNNLNEIYGYTYNLAVFHSLNVNNNSLSLQKVTGYNMSTSANIRDALVTESQVVNLKSIIFDTTSNIPQQRLMQYVTYGGIFLLSAPNENRDISPTINFNNYQPSSNTSVTWGAPLTSSRYDTTGDQSQSFFVSKDDGHSYRFKIFFNNCTWCQEGSNGFRLYRAHQLWGKNVKEYKSGNYNIYIKSRPNKTYFELAFKNRRAGCKENNLDFVPAVDTSYDNDPQGLATRLALAQCKPYYYKRPWFNELDEYYSEEGKMQTELADLIEEKSKDMDDITFIKTFKLDYETYAQITGDPL